MWDENCPKSSLSSSWTYWLTSNISNTISRIANRQNSGAVQCPSAPPPSSPQLLPSNPAPLRRSRSRTEKQRPVSFYLPSAPTLHERDAIPDMQAAQDPPILPRRNSMPVGEHSAAARSRLRYKAERRKSHSRQHDSLSCSSSIRGRRESVLSQYYEANESQDLSLSTENLQQIKARNRLSQPTMSSSDLARQREKSQNRLSQPIMNRRDSAAAQNRLCSPEPSVIEDGSHTLITQKAYNRLSLPIIPASPVDAVDIDGAFKAFASDLSANTNAMLGITTQRQPRRGRGYTRRQTHIWENPTSFPPPTSQSSSTRIRFLQPSKLKPKPKTYATTLEILDNPHRHFCDISHFPGLNAKVQMCHVWRYGISPAVAVPADPRPTSSWTVDTNGSASPSITHSLGWDWNAEKYGRRKFEGGSGFWAW